MRRVVAETREAIGRWRAARPEIFVHLELGAMPEAGMLSDLVEELGGAVDGIGCNGDELREVVNGWGSAAGERPEEMLAGLTEVRRRVPVGRVSVHGRELCLTLTDGDPEAERAALLFGSLVAAARARIGAFPALADLDDTLETVPSPLAGVAALEAMGLDRGIGRCGAGWLVGVPTMPLRLPAATVGLGDSFTAGELAAHE
jgi:ADP-dependent phosphofructokinase/glucokinase